MGSSTSPQLARHQVSGTCCADLPTQRPTPLPQDNHRLGWTTLLRHPIACLLPRGVPCSSNLSRRISTIRTVSTQRFGMGDSLPVREYQPVVHRLRLSASP